LPNSCAGRLLADSLCLTFAATTDWPVSQLLLINYRISTVLGCRFLSVRCDQSDCAFSYQEKCKYIY